MREPRNEEGTAARVMSETQANPSGERRQLTDRQADDGWCHRRECCGPASWCCKHADADHDCDGDHA